jgi:predicted deacetylase
LALLAPTTAGNPTQRQITVVLRYDDFSARSETQFETRLIEAFRERKLTCTFGIIPLVCAGDFSDPRPQELLSLPPEKVQLLREAVEAGIVEPALHGFSHQTNGLNAADYSEFDGLEYAEQIEKIRRGKSFLEEQLKTRVDVFCPPWHSYDANTIRALENASFRYISASFRSSVECPSSLRFVPATCDVIRLRQAVDHARSAPDKAPAIIVLFHPYDFTEVDRHQGLFTFEGFLGVLDWLVKQQDVRVKPIAHARGLAAGDYFRQRRFFARPRILPEGFWGDCPSFVLLSQTGGRDVIRRYYAVAVLLHGGALAACGVLAFAGAPAMQGGRPVPAKLCRYAGTTLAAAVVALVLADLKFGFRGLLAGVVACGGCVGLWAAHLRPRRRPA